MAYWVDEVVSRCQKRAESEGIERELYRLSVEHGEDAFHILTDVIRADAAYFREKCNEANEILELTDVWKQQLRVWTKPPHSCRVDVAVDGDCIGYEKSLRRNPGAEAHVETGRIFVKPDYQHSIWLEHNGRRMDFDSASELLLKDLFSSLLSEPK